MFTLGGDQLMRIRGDPESKLENQRISAQAGSVQQRAQWHSWRQAVHIWRFLLSYIYLFNPSRDDDCSYLQLVLLWSWLQQTVGLQTVNSTISCTWENKTSSRAAWRPACRDQMRFTRTCVVICAYFLFQFTLREAEQSNGRKWIATLPPCGQNVKQHKVGQSQKGY